MAALRAAVSNGDETDEYPAVVQLVAFGGRRFARCSGTVIGAQTILTAAHCLPEGTLRVEVTQASDLSTWSAKAASSWRRYPFSVKYSAAEQTPWHDVAVVQFEAPLGVPPVTLGLNPPQVGQTVTLVGYGQADGAASDGGKRQASSTVRALATDRFTLAPCEAGQGVTCPGDSGGPAFVRTAGGTAVQVGVHATCN